MSKISRQEIKVGLVATLGTIFEWYDLSLFATLAPIIAAQFLQGVDANVAFIFSLVVYAIGFIVRPFGALIFGRLGDIKGRKYNLLITITMMGFATCVVGLLPSYQSIGITAPIILILMRIIQGLSYSGEYVTAIAYVCENVDPKKRASFTSLTNAAGIIGFLLSLVVVMAIRNLLGEAAFNAWGWRCVFLISLALFLAGIWIRKSLQESQIFIKMKEARINNSQPLKESIGKWQYLKLMIIVLFGLVTGQAITSYAGNIYPSFFLMVSLKVSPLIVNMLTTFAMLLSIPFYLLFGILADKIGCKQIIMTGTLLAGLTYFPIFKAITHYANPVLETAQNTPVFVIADPATCHLHFSMASDSSCDIAKAKLTAASVNYKNIRGDSGTIASIKIADKIIYAYDSYGLSASDIALKDKEFTTQFNGVIGATGYLQTADPALINKPMVLLLLSILGIYAAMVYAPLGALMIKLFPVHIRITAISLPYHLGNGWFGGTLPFIAFALVNLKGNIYYGLWYPVIIALSTFVIGTIFIDEAKGFGDIKNDK